MIQKELEKIQKKEERFLSESKKEKTGTIQELTEKIEKKIPSKLKETLDTAFYKGFYLIFEKGTAVVEKSFKGEEMALEFKVNDFRVDQSPTRRSLKKMDRLAGKSKSLNSAITTVEGAGLGLLGIGLPDIPVFMGMLMKGIYETAVGYGFDYTKEKERVLILRMIYTALAPEEERRQADLWVEDWISHMEEPDVAYDFDEEVREAASALSFSMMTAKFVQGLPVVGVVGGVTNLMTYRRIIGYAALKYKKRYLRKKRKE
ncbi:EcsC family protein [Anaerotignum lactatifermentans]|nr:EcsC family protein [Anaerotignum lactatifermentans]